MILYVSNNHIYYILNKTNMLIMNANIRLCLLSFGIICLVIALPTYLCGCDNKFQASCVKYYVSNVNIVGYQINNHTCYECYEYKYKCYNVCDNFYNSTMCHEKCADVCVNQLYYDCFDVDAIGNFMINNKNMTCDLSVDKNEKSYNDSIAEAHKMYPFNSNIKMYIDKHSLTCETSKQIEILFSVGIIFFVLCGITFLFWLLLEMYSENKKYKLSYKHVLIKNYNSIN